MTYTYTYATLTREGREYVEDELQTVRRRPTEAQALYLPHGHYEVHTANGPIKVEAPVWIVYDAEGHPYPVTVEIFEQTWERV